MVPGTRTGPGEEGEHLDRRSDETSDHGEQVRWMRRFCDTDLCKEDKEFSQLVQEFHQKNVSKDQLNKKFREKLKSLSPEKRAKMGLTSSGAELSDADIDAFLSRTGCFENQLMAQIESDVKAKEKAHENMVENCVSVAQDEYGDFNAEELKNALKKEDPSRLHTFLDTPKYRKTYISKLPGSHALKTRDFSDVPFDEITRAVSTLNPSHPKRRQIQEAWLKIAQVAHPDKDLAHAFGEITKDGGPKVDIAGAYEAFFGPENTLISSENREKILNFLSRQYVPMVPMGVLETVDPKAANGLLTSETEKAAFEANLPADPELAKALKKDREEQWAGIQKRYIGGGKNIIATRNLPLKTKIRLLSQFGSAGKTEQMLEYYRGNPATLRSSTDTGDDFRRKFKQTYNLDPEKLDTRSGLAEELIARLGHRVEGIEHFQPGCVMKWTTKNEHKEDITGYYVIDTIPSDNEDDPEHDEILTVRFLGNDRDPLSPSGLAHHYTGADFYHYLDGCAEDGKITFGDGAEFEREMDENTKAKKLPRYFTEQETQAELRSQFPESTEIQNVEALNYEIDQILNPRNENKKESQNPEDRKLREGMIFTKITDKGIDTFEVREIDENNKTITLWDGWGKGGKSEMTMSFTEFAMTVKSLKEKSKEVFRIPVGKKEFGIKEFNQLCSLDTQFEDGKDDGLFKKMKQVSIREEGGVATFGKTDSKTGTFTAMPVVKVGDKKDLYIENISGSTVTFRRGTFIQGKFDKEKDTWTTNPEFKGSPARTMSLAMLWAYLRENQSFQLDKPIESAEKKESKEEGKLGWWNILMHSHSLGVILHGDLWKAPFKAWEEQHHKDHAFAGKMTAALAMEKLQSGGYGPVSGLWNWAEWPSLMVADGNSSFQSYLNELVEKIDGMGSFHRTKLIKKWASKEHFPSVKFMAAMCASMQIFGQLYPYDFGGDDYKNPDGTHEWFWYNSINHSLGHKHPHMPPHGEWPKEWIDKEGNQMSEIQACHKLFGDFKHPMLKNLGRRFQKYAVGGQKNLESGGEANLKERTTQTGKLEWMLSAMVGVTGKPPEAFGAATELWLKEGYPTEISTLPYAAAMFAGREKQLLPATQEHIRKQFQEDGVQIPMFVFMQSKNLGDVFRETSIAFAYTISKKCGDELQKLTNEGEHIRLSGPANASWVKRFQSFWEKNGKELMHKLSGMRDPMLNLMINDPVTFDEMLDDQPPEKQEEYKRLRENKGVIHAYYNRIKETFDSPTHCHMPRDKGFYSGDQFRYRKNFDIGYPIGWMNWDNYLDANLDKQYAAGEAAMSGDGVFNEIRGFMYDIPKLAEKMASEMGFAEGPPAHPKRKHYVHKISKGLFEKNRDQMYRVMTDLIKTENPEAVYCSATAMLLGLVPIKKLIGGTDPKTISRYDDYYEKMVAIDKKANEIALSDYPASIKYRSDMAKKWTDIIKKQIVTKERSIEEIKGANNAQDLDDDGVTSLKKNIQSRSGTTLKKTRDEFEGFARKGKNNIGRDNVQNHAEDPALSA